MRIKVSYDEATKIVLQSLKDNLEMFNIDFNMRLNGGFPNGVFKKDINEDLKAIKKHIKACERLIKYYDVGMSTYYERVEE